MRDGRIPQLVIGPGTEVIDGVHMIATAGIVDSHIHMICPQQVYDALASGVTSFIGGGTGPADGTTATTCTPGPWHIARMLEAAEGQPINWGLLGKGNSSRPEALREQIEAGACGLKDHEDCGPGRGAGCGRRAARLRREPGERRDPPWRQRPPERPGSVHRALVFTGGYFPRSDAAR